ncbi:cytochrome c-type biogenesis protein [Micrococcales bacterium KH10]|nr:cytochrome c-type biogenesis protein [Micrococcales bacterium KH10]
MNLSQLGAMTPDVLVIAQEADRFGTVIFSGAMLLAIPVALLAGLVSFASPCVLPLVPGYLGYLSGIAVTSTNQTAQTRTGSKAHVGVKERGSTRPQSTQATADAMFAAADQETPPATAAVNRGRMILGVGLFVAGFSAVFISLGVFFGTVGQFLRTWDTVIERGLGVVVILMGLAFIGAVPALQRERRWHISPNAGLWGAPLLGVAFGLGWTPCLGPTLTAINALALDGGSPARGAVLAVAYCIGLGLPFVLLAFGLGASSRIVAFLQRHRRAIVRIGGAMLIILGIALVSGLWGYISGQLQWWISGYETVL